MNATAQPQGRRINWLNVLTVMSAAILIGAEVFGGAFAAGWRLLPLRRRRYGALHHERPARRAVHRRLMALREGCAR